MNNLVKVGTTLSVAAFFTVLLFLYTGQYGMAAISALSLAAYVCTTFGAKRDEVSRKERMKEIKEGPGDWREP